MVLSITVLGSQVAAWKETGRDTPALLWLALEAPALASVELALGTLWGPFVPVPAFTIIGSRL